MTQKSVLFMFETRVVYSNTNRATLDYSLEHCDFISKHIFAQVPRRRLRIWKICSASCCSKVPDNKEKKRREKKAAVTVKPHKKPSYLAVKGGVPLSPTNDYQWLYKLIFASACS